MEMDDNNSVSTVEPPKSSYLRERRSYRLDRLERRPISLPGTASGYWNLVTLFLVESLWLSALVTVGCLCAAWLGLNAYDALGSGLAWLGGVVAASSLLGLYRVVTPLPAAEVRRLVITLAGSATLITAAQLPYLWRDPLQLCILPAVALLACLTLPFVRLVSRRLFSRFSWWGRRVLLVGGDARAAAVFHKLHTTPHWGLRPVGVLEEAEDIHSSIPAEYYCGPPDKLAVAAERLGASMTIVIPHSLSDYSTVDLFHASESNVNTWMIMPTPTQREIPSLWNEAFDLAGQPAIGWDNHLASRTQRYTKRAFDLTLAICMLPLLLPIIGAISLAIKLTCGGDVFFTQERIGRRGVKFRCRKFRTMHPNGKELLDAYLAANPAAQKEWERNFKLKNDPRVTWVGKFLRKTSLDELPQLFNVLCGEMSFVGPRPLLESELPRYGDAYASYVQMVPGITGLWQISGRSNTTFDDRAWLDEYYVRNWSPWLDIYILGCTIKVVLRCEGAY